ncbi:MAG TPA: hypothetical protein VF209_03290 [Patescibacteria group bacterium]
MNEAQPTSPIHTDQTLFAAQEPYLDSGRSALERAEAPASVPVYKQKKVILAVGGVLALLVVLLVASALMMNGGTSPMTRLEPSPTPQVQTPGKYATELKQLNDDLQKADPTQKELPFPPINPEIDI